MNDQTPSDPTPGDTPAPPDPWKSFRGVMAGTLILEAIVVLLALPVVGTSAAGLTWASGGFVVGLAVVVMAAGSGGLGRGVHDGRSAPCQPSWQTRRPDQRRTDHMTKRALITGITGQDGSYLA